MASYNFQKEVKVYVLYSNTKYSIDVSSIDFDQTFAEKSYNQRTLHYQKNLFEASIINKANPATFGFTMPLLKDTDLKIVFDLLVDYQTTQINLKSFDLYIETGTDVFKLEECVITNGSFAIEKSRPLSLTVSGEASKMSFFGAVGSVTIPGSAYSRAAALRYMANPELAVTLNSQSFKNIVSVSLELQNNIKWNPYTTVHNALTATNAATSMYPSTYVLTKRILSGSIRAYITSEKRTGELAPQAWDSFAPLVIQTGKDIGAGFRGITFNGNCTFTNRVTTGDVYTQNYDWRLIDNPSQLSSILSYTTGA